MSYLDSHCHINGEEFFEDIDVVLNNMVLSDVKKAMIISLNPKEYQRAMTINHKNIVFVHLSALGKRLLSRLVHNPISRCSH